MNSGIREWATWAEFQICSELAFTLSCVIIRCRRWWLPLRPNDTSTGCLLPTTSSLPDSICCWPSPEYLPFQCSMIFTRWTSFQTGVHRLMHPPTSSNILPAQVKLSWNSFHFRTFYKIMFIYIRFQWVVAAWPVKWWATSCRCFRCSRWAPASPSSPSLCATTWSSSASANPKPSIPSSSGGCSSRS